MKIMQVHGETNIYVIDVEVEGMAAKYGVKFGMVRAKVGTEVVRSSTRQGDWHDRSVSPLFLCGVSSVSLSRLDSHSMVKRIRIGEAWVIKSSVAQ
jgi:hypothetical protein